MWRRSWGIGGEGRDLDNSYPDHHEQRPGQIRSGCQLQPAGWQRHGSHDSHIGLGSKKFGLLCEMVPNARTVAMIINPNYPPHAADPVEVQSAAQSIGRQLLVLRAGSPQAIDSAFATLVEQRAGALLVGGDPFLVGRSHQLAAMAARHTIPAIYDFRESVLLGGLMSYGSIFAKHIGNRESMSAAFSRAKVGRSSGTAADTIRSHHQPRDRQGARP